MQRQEVNSTRIKSIGFDESSGTLELEFQGSGRVYQYKGRRVKEHYDGLMKAHNSGESVGAYFNSNVRHCPDPEYVGIKEQPPEG